MPFPTIGKILLLSLLSGATERLLEILRRRVKSRLKPH